MSLLGDDFRQNEDATNWIRIGEVSTVDPKNCTARVVFDDEDGFISNDLPVIQRNTQSTKDYWLPAVGEDVICIFLPCGEEDGFILGSFYADEIEPPTSSESKRYTEYPDGTVIEYDWEAHELKATGAAKINVSAPDIKFIGNLTVDGDITNTGKIVAGGDVSADGEVTAKAKTTNVKLSTHNHPTAVPGPASPPTPGS